MHIFVHIWILDYLEVFSNFLQYKVSHSIQLIEDIFFLPGRVFPFISSMTTGPFLLLMLYNFIDFKLIL